MTQQIGWFQLLYWFCLSLCLVSQKNISIALIVIIILKWMTTLEKLVGIVVSLLSNKKDAVDIRWPHKVGPNTRTCNFLVLVLVYYFPPLGVEFFKLLSFLYIPPNLNILVFLLFCLYCNIRYILLMFLLILHMNRIISIVYFLF